MDRRYSGNKMLLKEIIDNPTKSNDFSTGRNLKDENIPTDKLNWRASGYYADVNNIKDNPHEVVRHTSPKTGARAHDKFKSGAEEPDPEKYDEAFRVYAQALLRSNKATSNPYFPRIRAASIKQNEQFYVAERLFSMDDIYEGVSNADDHIPQMIYNLCEKTFETMEDIRLHVNNSFSALQNLLSRIEYAFHVPGAFADIKDSRLREAITFINNIKQRSQKTDTPVEIDLHGDNFMFRRGPTGLQIVITDPFVFKRKRRTF